MHKGHNIISYFILLIIFAGCQKEFDIAASDLKRLGTSARDLLSAEKYTALKVEVAYMPGYEPDAHSLQLLAAFLNTYLNKPDGIQVIKTPIKRSGKSTLSITDLVLLEKQNRSVFTQSNTITVYINLADAPFDEEGVLATSYWNTSFALFGPALYESAGGAGQVSRSKLLTVLLQHEFGHLLGLVGQGSPMQTPHRDANNGAHCSNPACLMYYGIETAENLGGSNSIPVLDAQCIADLKANGGK